jgi:hypothetical protein
MGLELVRPGGVLSRYRFHKFKLTPEQEDQLGMCERHGAKSHALVAAAVKTLTDYEYVQATSPMRIELAIEFLEQARYEIGASRFYPSLKTPPGRTPKARRKDPKPNEAKKKHPKYRDITLIAEALETSPAINKKGVK